MFTQISRSIVGSYHHHHRQILFQSMSSASPSSSTLLLHLTVRPNCDRTEIVGMNESTTQSSSPSSSSSSNSLGLTLRLNAPPRDGEANKELVRFFKKFLNCANSQLTLVTGLKSRHKVIELKGIERVEVMKRVKEEIGTSGEEEV